MGQPDGAARRPAIRNPRLRRAREQRHWTQADLARLIGTTNLTVSRWELGVQQPVPFFREKLCALFGMSARDLGLMADAPPPAAADVPAPRELPRPAADFTGRAAELERLRELLEPGGPEAGGPVVVSAIDGMAGIGKSALAIQAGHLLAGAFPDGQLYVHLRGATPGLAPLEPLDALGRMLRSLGFDPAAIPADVEEASARFRSLAAERRLLVVLDDARGPEQVRPLLPGSLSCAVLVTSRRVLATLDGVRLLHLDVLGREQAVSLLGRIAGRERVAAEPEAAAEVVERCGRLPLAIRIAGARLAARPGWPIRELAGGLADAAGRLEALQAGELAVRVSFDVSLHALGEGDAAAFALLSLPDGPDLGVETAARLLDATAPAAAALLERLVDAQLLETPRPGRYQFHDLVRLHARARAADRHAAPARSAALARAFGFLVATAWRTAALLRPSAWRLAAAGERWTAGGLEFPDAPAALDWLEEERGNLLAAVAQAARDALGDEPSLPPELSGQLASALYGFFEMRSYWSDQAEANQAGLAVARRTGDRAGEALALNDLGMALDRLGRYPEALARLRESLAISRDLGDVRGQAVSLFYLSLCHLWLGDLDEAIAGQRESLALYRRLGDRVGQAVGLSTLASVHGRLEQYEEATACLRESLDISRELGDRLGEATALTNLGTVARHLGRYEEAVACLRESLGIFRAFGHRGQANSLHDLGVAYGLLGRHEEAIGALREALERFRDLGHRRGQAMALRDLGDALRTAGRAEEAAAAWREGLEIGEALRIPEVEELRGRLAAAEAAAGGGLR
ncbi:MAG TPA: tetratricopeptide repeat protein [Candidatus Dormibacteraeota bacterium]